MVCGPPYDNAHSNSHGFTQSALEIATQLEEHGCENITERLDIPSCSSFPLSRGGFGDVYRGSLHDGTQVAIKTMRFEVNSADDSRKALKVSIFISAVFVTLRGVQHAARELHTWSKCQHPNVVPLLGLAEFRDEVGMVSLWMDNGSLPSYLSRNPDVDRCQLVCGCSLFPPNSS
jgi:hypothetical protein